MQNIEPYRRWESIYQASSDEQSPFFGESNDQFICRDTIYNHYIHPLWDNCGSNTLYLKILFTSYEKQFAIIELMGEWNDCLYNDIMHLYRNIVEPLIDAGIQKFILIGENILNFHYSEDDYYEEWFDNCDEGWIIAVNFREHVLQEFDKLGLNNYLLYGGKLNEVKWRTIAPIKLFEALDAFLSRSLNP